MDQSKIKILVLGRELFCREHHCGFDEGFCGSIQVLIFLIFETFDGTKPEMAKPYVF